MAICIFRKGDQFVLISGDRVHVSTDFSEISRLALSWR